MYQVKHTLTPSELTWRVLVWYAYQAYHCHWTKMVRKTEQTEPLLTLPLSGQAAIRCKTDVLFQHLLYLVNGFSWTQDSGRDEDSRIDADQCTGHVDDVQYAAPGALLRSSVAVLSWNIKSDQSEWSQWHKGSLTKTLCSKKQSFPDM